jgi:hypothetical protein
MRDQSQIVNRVDVRGLSGKNLPIELLCLFQLPGPVVLSRQIEGLLDREWGHERSAFIPAGALIAMLCALRRGVIISANASERTFRR